MIKKERIYNNGGIMSHTILRKGALWDMKEEKKWLEWKKRQGDVNEIFNNGVCITASYQ
jgi:hypothetical protein